MHLKRIWSISTALQFHEIFVKCKKFHEITQLFEVIFCCITPTKYSFLFISRTLINDLIYCYTVTIKCNLFEAVRWTESFWNDDLPDFPFPQYVGVESSYTYHTTFTSRVLAYLTSKPIEDQNIRYVMFCFHVFIF